MDWMSRILEPLTSTQLKHSSLIIDTMSFGFHSLPPIYPIRLSFIASASEDPGPILPSHDRPVSKSGLYSFV